jgi:hypothetical protein
MRARSRRPASAVLAACALLGLGAQEAAADPEPAAAAVRASAAAPAPGAPPIRLQIERPDGRLVEADTHLAEVRGIAAAEGEGPRHFDVVIALDVSASTRSASGADVDGDGEVGEDPRLGLFAPGEYAPGTASTDPEDTILHAEVLAARTLLEGLDPRRVRVALVTFSGDSDPSTGERARRDQQDAWLEVPLTDDFGRVRGALDQVLTRGPHGATNFAAGIRLATTELAGLSGAVSRPREGAGKVVLFLTDGVPSFPVGRGDVSDPGDLEAAVNAARVAQAGGIRIHTFALGTDALTRPKAATEVARVTLGTFTPVLEPGAIVAALQSVSFANVEDVGVVNLTTREMAGDVRLNPDGSFVAFVPVQEGENRVLVNAVASDGSEVNREIRFTFRKSETEDARMRERELARLRRLNAELIRHLEAERIKAERRRRRMEREIEIRAEPAPAPEAAPPAGDAGQRPPESP